jgi:hypothetical protein
MSPNEICNRFTELYQMFLCWYGSLLMVPPRGRWWSMRLSRRPIILCVFWKRSVSCHNI